MDRERGQGFFGMVDAINEWNRMREVGVGRHPGARRDDLPGAQADAWVPASDIFARGTDLVLRFSLSGVRREDVEVSLLGDVLTVSGRRKDSPDWETDATPYVRELYYGAFRRSVNLPTGVDDDDVSADYRDGMLEVTLRGAAAEHPEPRRIEIRSSEDG